MFSIAIPYVIWCSVYYLYYVACTNIPFISRFMSGSETTPLSFMEWISWLWVKEYYTLWFLKNLIIFIALAPIIWLLFNEHLKIKGKTVPIGFCLLIAFFLVLKAGVIPFTLPSGFNVYCIGAYIGMNLKGILRYKNKIISLLGVIYLVFVFATDFRYKEPLLLLAFLAAIYVSLDLVNLGGKKLPWWMSITFFTYVAHDLFLELFEKVFLIVGGRSALMAILDYVFMPIVTLVFLIGLAWVIRKTMPWLWKVICGR